MFWPRFQIAELVYRNFYHARVEKHTSFNVALCPPEQRRVRRSHQLLVW
jgi:hypothetical protein